ncbi:hypothetical protein SAMN05421736_1138 [Evansella caseinilytica]|uniref:Uncharacterized protein n=1 Tax=Evansella caseinilytica TaxID=1503961 RepID=A0A1H3T5B2_9BACI|nr:hypothetical protein [Evansella caseinilytica]SDZ44539.1 hypothetical protein SAMN05421736_1138 [Evansella caseinilytica]
MSVWAPLSFANEKEISESNDSFLNEGLNPGEEVVGFYTEIIPESELNDDLVEEFPFIESNILLEKETEITPASLRNPRWFAASKEYVGRSYSSWMYAGASTISGGTLSASHSSSVSNTFSGQLELSKKALSAFVNFDITYTTEKAVTYTSPEYPDGRYRLLYRHVYKKYKVKQEKKYHSKSKVLDTKYVYPQKWVERQYKVVKF